MLLELWCEQNTNNKGEQALSHHNTVFQQLLKTVSRHDFESLAKQHHSGQQLRSVSRWDQFLGMAMSQLTGRQSLRDIEANLQVQRSKLYHLGAKPIARSSLARVNEKQPYELYEALFYRLLRRTTQQPTKHKFRFKNPLFSLDASLIDLSIKLFPWALSGHSNAAVKLNVGLNHGNMIPEFVALSDGNDHDVNEGRKFDFPEGSIIVFDKGYLDYAWYKSLTKKGIFFVTRLRINTVYDVVTEHETRPGTGVISDQTIKLSSNYARKQELPVFRRVEYRDDETGKTYEFLTNHFHLSANTIAAIYKDRWQVELFFKAIKQTLKLKAFVGRSRNAIFTQIWIAMCVYLMLSIVKFLSRASWPVHRIMRVLQLSLFERRSLIDIINPSPPPDPHLHPQMGLRI